MLNNNLHHLTLKSQSSTTKSLSSGMFSVQFQIHDEYRHLKLRHFVQPIGLFLDNGRMRLKNDLFVLISECLDALNKMSKLWYVFCQKSDSSQKIYMLLKINIEFSYNHCLLWV